jgi:hypothetical protein
VGSPLRKAAEWITRLLSAGKTELLRRVSCYRRKRRILLAVLAPALLVPVCVLFFGQSPGVTEEAQSLPLHTRVLEEALRFLEKARINPTIAFSQFANAGAGEYFQELGESLWQTVHPDLGWRWFFHGALMTMAEETNGNEANPANLTNSPPNTQAPRADEALVAFYHPWSDTALITAWSDTALIVPGIDEVQSTHTGLRIHDCEIVMGDIFRTRGSQKPATTRAWARRQQYFAAAIAHTSALSLRSLELLSFPSNTSAISAPDNKITWRSHIPFLLDADKLEANHIGAGILMLAAINDVARYAAPTNAFAIRVLPALQQLHSKTNAVKMAPEASAALQGIPGNYLDHYIPALYANSKMRAFIMLQAKQDPKRCLALLFGLEAPEEEDKNRSDTSQAPLNNEALMDELNPVIHYSLKLLRLDPVDIQAVYTNLYPK